MQYEHTDYDDYTPSRVPFGKSKRVQYLSESKPKGKDKHKSDYSKQREQKRGQYE